MSVENKPKYYVIMWKFLQPAAHKPELPAEKVDKEYSRLRRQVFWGIFIGYAGYYLVRKNFSIAMPALESMGYDKADLGWALSAVSIAYGISKFVMGTVSDRSNARVFIPLGLIASALIMIFMGVLPWGSISIPVAIMAMFCLLFINGWMQGMGWPPCGRVMTHWFCTKERGVKMSVWNVAHNIGGAAMAPEVEMRKFTQGSYVWLRSPHSVLRWGTRFSGTRWAALSMFRHSSRWRSP